jgi:hypothetical protein
MKSWGSMCYWSVWVEHRRTRNFRVLPHHFLTREDAQDFLGRFRRTLTTTPLQASLARVIVDLPLSQSKEAA